MMIEARGVLAKFNTVKMQYGATASAIVRDAVCEICEKRGQVIGIDLSGGEYGQIDICGPCLRKLAENV